MNQDNNQLSARAGVPITHTLVLGNLLSNDQSTLYLDASSGFDANLPITVVALVATRLGSDIAFKDVGPSALLSNFSVTSKVIGAAPFTLTAPLSNSAGAFTYSSSNPAVATISGTTVTIVGAGTTTITATQAATATYASNSITAIFTVTPPPPPISLNNGTLTYIGNAALVPTFSALFFEGDLRGTGSEWFAVVKNGMKSKINAYANGTNGPFIPSGQTVPVPFNNIVTTLMTNLSSTFLNTVSSQYSFNEPIDSWDTAQVTNMSNMFAASAFNQPLNSWNTANVLSMNEMFSYNDKFNRPIGSWNTANVTNMDYMFDGASSFNQNISGWNVYKLTSAPNEPTNFSGSSLLSSNEPDWRILPTLSFPNVVKSMVDVPISITPTVDRNALSFDGVNDYIDFGANITELAKASFTIECWIKTTGTSMSLLNCQDNGETFNWGEKSLYIDENGIPVLVGWGNNWIYSTVAVNDNAWHHIAVTWSYSSGISGTGALYIDGINRTLTDYSTYTSYIGNTTNIGIFTFGKLLDTSFSNFFNGSVSELRIWNVARTENEIRFNYNKEVSSNSTGLKAYYKFNQGTANGNNTGLTTLIDSTNAVNGTLVGFALSGTTSNYVPSGFVLGAALYAFDLVPPTSNSSGLFTYTNSNPSVATISGNTVAILAIGSTNITATQAAAGSYKSGSVTATLTVVSNEIVLDSNNVTYRTVRSSFPSGPNPYFAEDSSGTFYAVMSNTTDSKTKIRNYAESYKSGFTGNVNTSRAPFTHNGTLIPFNRIITTYMTDMSSMFWGLNFNEPVSSWDTANVFNMDQMFRFNTIFNQPINSWNTAKVIWVGAMFCGCTEFNQPLDSWNTARFATIDNIFNSAPKFNQNINSWNMANVDNIGGAFINAYEFNQPLNLWNTVKVRQMGGVFNGASKFNQPIGSWNTANVLSMISMFQNASNFNQPIGSWNTANVVDMYNMFLNATNFNQPINTWNVTLVNDFGNFKIGSALSTANTPPKFR